MKPETTLTTAAPLAGSAIQQAFEAVNAARAAAERAVEESDALDARQFQGQPIPEGADALAGARQADGWARWEAALAGLLAIPAATVADIEVKFRAIADADGPEALDPSAIHRGGLGAIWADLRRLSQQPSVA